jgi:hypothetical protein
MYGRNVLKGIPKCHNCMFYRQSDVKDEIGKCIKYLGSHHKPVSIEIARYNYMMCGYYGTQYVPCDLTVVKPSNASDVFVFQPHI